MVLLGLGLLMVQTMATKLKPSYAEYNRLRRKYSRAKTNYLGTYWAYESQVQHANRVNYKKRSSGRPQSQYKTMYKFIEALLARDAGQAHDALLASKKQQEAAARKRQRKLEIWKTESAARLKTVKAFFNQRIGGLTRRELLDRDTRNKLKSVEHKWRTVDFYQPSNDNLGHLLHLRASLQVFTSQSERYFNFNSVCNVEKLKQWEMLIGKMEPKRFTNRASIIGFKKHVQTAIKRAQRHQSVDGRLALQGVPNSVWAHYLKRLNVILRRLN